MNLVTINFELKNTNRRDFHKTSGALGLGLIAGQSVRASEFDPIPEPGFFNEEAKKLPACEFDVMVAGVGTVKQCNRSIEIQC